MESATRPVKDTQPERRDICREDESDDQFVTLPCTHRFHSEGIRERLSRGSKPTCPYCRRDLIHTCGHSITYGELATGMFASRHAMPSHCTSCSFKMNLKNYFRIVRLGAEIHMNMSEAWPEESMLQVINLPRRRSFCATALNQAWDNIQEIRSEIGGVIEFARLWHELPNSHHRRTEDTPDTEILEALERLRSAVRIITCTTPIPTDTMDVGEPRAGPLDARPDWIIEWLRPTQFPELYQRLHELTLSFGFEDPYYLAEKCKEEGSREDGIGYEEEDEDPSDEELFPVLG